MDQLDFPLKNDMRELEKAAEYMLDDAESEGWVMFLINENSDLGLPRLY